MTARTAASASYAVPGQPGELLDHDRARDVAARVAAHPVGDHEDRRLGEVRVLVDLADQADVGRRGVPELGALMRQPLALVG